MFQTLEIRKIFRLRRASSHTVATTLPIGHLQLLATDRLGVFCSVLSQLAAGEKILMILAFEIRLKIINFQVCRVFEMLQNLLKTMIFQPAAGEKNLAPDRIYKKAPPLFVPDLEQGGGFLNPRTFVRVSVHDTSISACHPDSLSTKCQVTD